MRRRDKNHSFRVNRSNPQAILPRLSRFVFQSSALWSLTSVALLVLADRPEHSTTTMNLMYLVFGGITSLFLPPILHLSGKLIFPNRYNWFQPGGGGNRFVILQALSWVMFSFLLLFILHSLVGNVRGKGMLPVAGVIGCLSQAMMVSSLLTFDPKMGHVMRSRHTAKVGLERGTIEFGSIDSLDLELSSFDSVDSPVVSGMFQLNFSVVLIGGILTCVSHQTDDPNLRVGFASLSLLCVILGVTLTHGVGGLVLKSQQGWRFSQAFQGGLKFVLVQILAWTLFGLFLLLQGIFIMVELGLVSQVVFGRAFSKEGALVGALAALASHLLVFKSLEGDLFQPPSRKTSSSQVPTLRPLSYSVLVHTVVLTYYNSHFVIPLCLLCAMTWQAGPSVDTLWCWISTYSAVMTWCFAYSTAKTLRGTTTSWQRSLSLSILAVLLLGASLHMNRASPLAGVAWKFSSLALAYFGLTYTGLPECSAARENFWYRDQKWLFQIFADYFDAKILVSKKHNPLFHESGPVILGYHPHGIFPSTAIWLPLTPAFRDALPHLHVNTLTASITHLVPGMREIIQWAGCADVSRQTLHRLLTDPTLKRSPLVVVGGQREMLMAKSWTHKIPLVRGRRRGLFQIAIQENVPLVPMFGFGETLVLDNVYLPKIQRLFKSVLGFPLPFWFVGRLGLPLPRRKPISVAIGVPVYPQRANPTPSEAEVSELQARYFAQLARLFDQYKEEANHGEFRLVWEDE